MNRYLVIAGCSFTCYWPEILAKKLGYISANNGMTAAGNEIIHYQTIYAIDTLLNNGVDPDNILPIISWGEVNRQDFIINHIDTPNYDLIMLDVDRYEQENKLCIHHHFREPYLGMIDSNGKAITSIKAPSADPDGKSNTWIKSGGHMAKGPYWETYYGKYHTEEQHFLNLLMRIHHAQMYFEKNNLDYRMINWQNIFHERKGKKSQVNESQCFNSKKARLLADKYPSTKHIWNMIDLSRFIFYEDDFVSMGGIGEFTVRNNIIGDGGKVGHGHPTEIGCGRFVDDVLLPEVSYRTVKD
jgi:hypothetical protein